MERSTGVKRAVFEVKWSVFRMRKLTCLERRDASFCNLLAVIPSSVLQVVDVKEISGIRGRLKQYYECNCSFKVN